MGFWENGYYTLDKEIEMMGIEIKELKKKSFRKMADEALYRRSFNIQDDGSYRKSIGIWSRGGVGFSPNQHLINTFGYEKKIELWLNDGTECFFLDLGYWGIDKNYSSDPNYAEERLLIVSFLKFSYKRNLGRILNYKKLIQYGEVSTFQELKNKNIEVDVFKVLVNDLNYLIMTHPAHHHDTEKKWKNIPQGLSFTIDIVDIKNEKIIAENITIKSGESYEKFIEKYLLNNNDKQIIRYIIKRIS